MAEAYSRRKVVGTLGAALVLGPAARAGAAEVKAKGQAKGATGMSAHAFEFISIDGETLRLADFKGKAVLVVNTASFCAFTPQYRELEQVWDRYKASGLVVIGVPSNDFGEQEPGTAAEIKTFCESYDVSFPLTQKQTVVGAGAHPFYRWIAAELGEGAAPRWNFHKYLIDRDGAVVALWPSRVTPNSREIVAAIEEVLAPAR